MISATLPLALSDNATDIINNIVTGVVGILGAVAGVVVERLLRSRGKIIIHTAEWSLSFSKKGSIAGLEEATPETARYAQYRFRCEVFNGKDEPVGLRNVRVRFHAGGAELFSLVPRDESTGRDTGHSREFDELIVLNLPPKVWTTTTLKGWPDSRFVELSNAD